jgi:phosphoenolpyruvate carboxykinase (GTP)
VIDPNWEDPAGVPISAIIFGGRRGSVVPLVTEALNWEHGVFLGATISSEMTAAAVGTVGKLRHDPFAMLPFCGYNMGDYFKHWIEMGKKGKHLPKIYQVNWFRKNEKGEFIWPGFGDNSRVLKWIFERSDNSAPAIPTPLGLRPQQLDLAGIDVPEIEKLFEVDSQIWKEEADSIESYFKIFGGRLPAELTGQLNELRKRLT